MLVSKNLYNIEYDFALIDNQSKLQNLVAQINHGDVIALDTEFTRRDTYYAILSTIQIALKHSRFKRKIIVLIDALANLDLKPILTIICDPNITKIIHSSSQDIQILQRLANAEPQHIRDTQVMANFCEAKSNIGYATLVSQQFGIDLCKKMQISNWQERPLKNRQIDYALSDVIFLHEIYENFHKQLKSQNFVQFFEEEMTDFVKKSLQDNSTNLIRSFSYKSRNPLRLACVHNLILIREKYARIYNLPREHLLKNHELIMISENYAHYDFSSLSCYQNFVKDIRRAMSQDYPDREDRAPQLLPHHKNQINKIKSLIAKCAKKYRINEQFLLNSTSIKDIVLSNKIDNILNAWRRDLLGTEIKKILNHNL